MPYPILEPNRDVPDHYRPQAPQVIVDLAREFIDAAEWTFASTMPQHPHHYVVKAREEAAGRHGYGFLRALIVEYHYLREWNGRSFRAVTLSGLTLWIMQTGLIVINAKPAEPDDWASSGTLFDFLP